MRPYIGILIDSFWEAVSNRVLWALLIGWTIILGCLAPFGYVTERSYRLYSNDISQRTEIIEKLARGLKGRGPEDIQSIAGLLEPEFQQRVAEAAEKEDRSIRSSELAEGLNHVLETPGLYSEDAFPTAQRRDRLVALIEADPASLSDDETEQLNRELMQLAFPSDLQTPQGVQLWIGYGGFKLGNPLPINRKQIREFLEPLALQVIIKFGLAVLAVFVAIIVTSPIIPETFRSGSLHLLLSKPISRVWLYLVKFFGGSIFVLVNITFVMIGLYLIAGIRFEIWNVGLLWCIPILLFVFIIFYAVSGLAGLLWGNAIVCVVSCMLFWFCCFVMSAARSAIQPHVEINPQITKVNQIEDYLTVVSENGDFKVWNEEYGLWQPAVENRSGNPKRSFGPIYDQPRQRILYKAFFRNPLGGGFLGSARNIGIISLEKQAPENTNSSGGADASGSTDVSDGTESLTSVDAAPSSESAASHDAALANSSDTERDSGPKSSSEAREEALWDFDTGPDIPSQLFDLVSMGDEVIAVCRGGLFRLDLEQLDLVEASKNSLFGVLDFSSLVAKPAFDNAAPENYYLSENSTAAALEDGTGLVVFSSGRVDLLRFTEEGKFDLEQSSELPGEADNTEAALVRMNDSFCVVARHELPLEILDAQLQPIATVELESDHQVKQLSWLPATNQVVIVTHSGELLRLDCESASIEDFGVPVSGVSSISWRDSSHAWLGVKPNAAYLVDMNQKQVVDRRIPTQSMLERIYNYAINPLYRVLPKPAALDDAMLYVLTGNDTQTLNIVTNDLEAAKLDLDLVSPFASNLAFVAFILAASSFYVARKEF